MKFYDISRELFSSKLYPGDPEPCFELLKRIETGDDYNLSSFSASSHAATHIDAPKHFIFDGKSIDALDLSLFFGPCTVFSISGLITGEDAEEIVKVSKPRILFRGQSNAYLSQSAAFVFADSGVLLIGTDAQSIALSDQEEIVHKELLLAQIPILEGLNLSSVQDGHYILSAFPLKLGALEAAPVRAVLIKD